MKLISYRIFEKIQKDGVVMKNYMKALGFIFLIGGEFLYGIQASEATYDIKITSYGDDALVQAIHNYSYLTKADVDKWKFSWAPVVGEYIRGNMMDKVRRFVTVCNSIYFAKYWFQSSQDLMSRAPGNWTSQRICLALNDLEKQGDYALALLGDLGAIGSYEQQWEKAIEIYIKNIKYNQSILGCSGLKVEQKKKAAKKLEEEENKLKYNKLWWQNMQLRWKVAKDVGKNVFAGTKWLVQTANEYSAPLLSAGAVWFAYNKLFGLPQTPAK